MLNKKYQEILFGVLICLSVLGICWAIFTTTHTYEHYVERAWLSVESSCQSFTLEEQQEWLNDRGLVITGYYQPSNDSIVILDRQRSPTVDIHELCHKQQNLENRSYGCSNKIFSALNEIECYLVQEGKIDMNFEVSF